MKDGTKVNLILGSHAHVPSGAPEDEFAEAYENKLRPFVCSLYRYPKIQAVLHYSGVLLHWVERNHPEFFMLIDDMISRRQAEILGGGFYEPMLPLIPLQDRIGQIELMTTYLRKHFGKRPLGCWIPAMAWEQHLAGALAASGMNYTFLSEKQFVQAGLSGRDLYYPCISEDQGKIITVFPVALSVETALGAVSGSDEHIVTVFPEKPAADRGKAADFYWNRFFENLSLDESPVETALPSRLIRNCRGLKKASFPNSSGLDEDYLPRRFLIEHPEADGIYAKMIFANVLIGQLRGDKSRKQSAREELWKAQDSGIFTPSGGGPGRHELRKAAYHSLLSAELLCREKGRFVPSLVQYDFDLDGVGEFLFQEAKINCYIQLAGACIIELDYLPKTWNYLDSGSVNSTWRRTAFADILLPSGTGAEELAKRFPSGSRLCFTEQYEIADKAKSTACFRLQPADPGLNLPFGNIAIEKRFTLKKDILTVHYAISNQDKIPVPFCFVPEINLSFAGDGEKFVRFFAGAKEKPLTDGALNGIEGLKIHDIKNEIQIQIGSAKTFSGCLAPARYGDFYQSTRIMPLFNLSLESGEVWNNEFSLKFFH